MIFELIVAHQDDSAVKWVSCVNSGQLQRCLELAGYDGPVTEVTERAATHPDLIDYRLPLSSERLVRDLKRARLQTVSEAAKTIAGHQMPKATRL